MPKNNTQFFQTLPEIEAWLSEHSVTDYVIDKDLIVHVNNSVHLELNSLVLLPVQFGTVYGNFFCHNNSLTSLFGCPKVVNLDFNCAQNNLISLEYAPDDVGRDFICSRNSLTGLEFCPSLPNGSLYASHNKITSLEIIPKIITGYVELQYNEPIDYKDISNFEILQKTRFAELASTEMLLLKSAIANPIINKKDTNKV